MINLSKIPQSWREPLASENNIGNPFSASANSLEREFERLPLDQTPKEELRPLNLAEALGKTFPRFYCLGGGLCWDDVKKRIRWTIPFQKGCSHDGTVPVSRAKRRAVDRSIQKKKKKLLAEEREWFNELYHCCSMLQDYEIESLEQDVPDGEGKAAEVKAAIDRLRKLFENKVSENFVLRSFLWLINEIAEEILGSQELRDKFITEPTAFTRVRQLTLSEMFTILLTMAGDNLNNELYEYFKMKPEHPSVQAFVMRRGQITADCMEYLYKRVTEACKVFSMCVPSTTVFPEFESIFGVDGSDVNIHLNPDDDETYIDGGKGGKGWNQFHLNAILDARVCMFVNALIQPKKKTHETQAVADMLREMVFNRLSLFLGDRGYGSLNLIETIRRKANLECVIRVKEDWIKEVKNLPLKELDKWLTIHVITTQRNEDKERIKRGEAKYLSGESVYGKNKTSKVWDFESEVDVTFRVVRFPLKSGGWETLVTTLDEEKYPVERLKELYFLRWGSIENSFRVLKWDNHLAQMHGKKKEFAKQEVWARLAMHNIVSCIVNIANEVERLVKPQGNEVAQSKKKEQKHERVINRRFATHIVCDFLKNVDHIQFDVIQMILRHKEPVRPGRSFKRDMRAIGFAQFFYR